MVRSHIGPRFGRLALAITLAIMAATTLPAKTVRATGNATSNASDQPDHDDALNARARGEIKPLDEILQLLKPRASDRMVDVVLDRRDGRWIYEVTWLTKFGRYRIFTVNAKDGVILKDEIK